MAYPRSLDWVDNLLILGWGRYCLQWFDPAVIAHNPTRLGAGRELRVPTSRHCLHFSQPFCWPTPIVLKPSPRRSKSGAARFLSPIFSSAVWRICSSRTLTIPWSGACVICFVPIFVTISARRAVVCWWISTASRSSDRRERSLTDWQSGLLGLSFQNVIVQPSWSVKWSSWSSSIFSKAGLCRPHLLQEIDEGGLALSRPILVVGNIPHITSVLL